MPTVRVVARLIAFPDKVDDLKALLLKVVESTRTETGCIRYELLQNQADPTDFTFVEEWGSDEALNTHLGSEHVGAALARAPELLVEGPDIRRYSLLI